MKLNAIGVTTSNISKTLEFYKLLGFEFPEVKPEDSHFEVLPIEDSTRLMFDNKQSIKEMCGENAKPSNTSSFAIEFDTPEELNKIAKTIKEAGFTIVKEPWDAFWGQRYAVVSDPDGYKIDLYSNLK